jgi:hypothetical protein
MERSFGKNEVSARVDGSVGSQAETSLVSASAAVVRKASIGFACAGLKDAVTGQPVDCERDDHSRARMRTHASPSAQRERNVWPPKAGHTSSSTTR